MANEKRLIDANALIAYFEEQYNVAMDDPDPVSGYVMAALRCCIDYFKTIPTVDAVEVVYCGECRFADTKDCPMSGSAGRVSASDFCSYGERKDHG